MTRRPDAARVDVVRAYGDAGAAGASRVLVDRLWPRGVRKADAALDEWCAAAAPSAELRRWYAHDPARFADFARRYRAELAREPASAAVDHLAELARGGPLVLVTATRDVARSGASVLRDVVLQRLVERG